MATNEAERRRDFIIGVAAGRLGNTVDNLLEQYSTASREQQQKIGRVIMMDISEIKKGFPEAAKVYDDRFRTCVTHYKKH